MYALIKERAIGTALIVVLGTASLVWASEESAEPESPAPPAPSQLPFEIPELEPGDVDGSAVPPAVGGSAVTPGSSAPSVATAQAMPAVSGAGVPHEDIRDIRGPIGMPASRALLWVAFAAVAGLVALALVWRWLRRRTAVRARRAYEIAFDELEKIRALMHPDQAREFSYHVSETVRVYIDKRFSLGVSHCTTQELIRDLVEAPSSPLAQHTERLRDFLGHCDMAKFARGELTVGQMEAMHGSAWDFVDETRPRPEDERKKRKRSATTKTQAHVPANVPAFAAGGES